MVENGFYLICLYGLSVFVKYFWVIEDSISIEKEFNEIKSK